MIKKVLSVLLVIALTVSFALAFSSCKKDDETETETTTEPVTEAPRAVLSANRNPLTGLDGYDEGFAGRKFTGIVVENSPAARPQWGLSTPDVLVEYEVEGGITRMLWLYANESRVPATVGPVRSARHDIVELAMGFDMLFIHCGGSSFALDLIGEHPELAQIEGLQYYDCFERDTTRDVSSEHRYCLLGDRLVSSVESLGFDMTADPAKAQPFLFTDVNAPRALSGSVCTKADISFSASYNYTFNYNAQTGLYDCDINGSPRTDDTGVQCAYSNVIILYVDMADMGTSSGHQDLLLENGGRGLYINGGACEEITWAKPAEGDMLKMYSASGAELALNCGSSYVGLVRSTQAVKTVLG